MPNKENYARDVFKKKDITDFFLLGKTNLKKKAFKNEGSD